MKTPVSPAQKAADAVTNAPIKFYVRKKNIPNMLAAITGQRPNPMAPHGVPGLQDRTDISGKFARKMAQNRRALERIAEQLQEERQDMVKRHAEKYPEGHERAGEPTPVYQTQQDGSPMFKKNAAGNDTEERLTIPDQFNVADPAAYQKDYKDMLDEFVVVECPGFTIDEFESFKSNPGERSPIGKLIDPLLDLEVGGDSTKVPPEFVSLVSPLTLFGGDRETGDVEDAQHEEVQTAP